MKIIIPARIICDICKIDLEEITPLSNSFSITRSDQPEDQRFFYKTHGIDLCRKCSNTLLKFIDNFKENYPEEFV